MSIVITEAEVKDALRQEGYRNPTARQKRKMIRILRDNISLEKEIEFCDAHRFKMIDGVMTDTYAVKALA